MAASAAERAFLDRVVALLGAAAVDEAPDERRFFAEDALGRRKQLTEAAEPLAVVRPADAVGVAALLKLASEAGVPVVPYGAGTGLMGGARSIRPGIVLDTNRLNTIEVLAGDRVAWAGAGVILQDLDTALRTHGLCFGHDPWTFPVATVGGTLNTNSLGYRGGRYGGMGDQAVGLEVALADGTLFRTRALPRHSAGPRYERLFIGSEGTLGVITAAALRAYPVPERQELRAFNFDSFAAGFEVIDRMTALGMRPSLLDYGEEHASPWPDIVSRDEEPPLLYVGFEGRHGEVELLLSQAEALIATAGGRPLGSEKAQEFWDDRHVVAERFSRARRRREGRPNWGEGAARDFMHVALPASQVLPFQEYLHRETRAQGVGLLECGLWTAPECFSAVLALTEAAGGQERLSECVDGYLRKVQDFGGSMEYVHGAGLRLAHLMPREHGEGFSVLQRLKAELDPAGILNPGKLGL